MLRKTLPVYISLVVVFTFLLISCNITGEDCGPFDNHFEVTDFQTDLKRVTSLDSTGINLTAFEADTILYRNFAVNMIPVPKFYSSNVDDGRFFNFISAAYACSPPIPTSEETIKDIQIYSDKPFNDNYSSEDNLAEIFDVFVSYQGREYRLHDLIEFLDGKPAVPDEMTFLLSSPLRPQKQFSLLSGIFRMAES